MILIHAEMKRELTKHANDLFILQGKFPEITQKHVGF